MKRAVIVIVVVALLLGIGYIGLSPRYDTAEAMVKELPGAYDLVMIVENLPLEPGGEYRSDWLDVKSFRLFKLYAGIATDGSYTPPETSVKVLESPLGAGLVTFGSTETGEWQEHPTGQSLWCGKTFEFDGLYSKIAVGAKNRSADKVETITLFLFMAKE